MTDAFDFKPTAAEDETQHGGTGGAGKVKFDRLTIKKYSDKMDVDFDLTAEIGEADAHAMSTMDGATQPADEGVAPPQGVFALGDFDGVF